MDWAEKFGVAAVVVLTILVTALTVCTVKVVFSDATRARCVTCGR